MSFSENFRDYIEYNDIKLSDLSIRCKIPYNTLRSYITNRSLPNIQTAYILSQKLNVTMEYLVTGNISDNYYKDKNLIPELKELSVSSFKLVRQIIRILFEFEKLKKEKLS